MSTLKLPVKLTKNERLALSDEQAAELNALEAVEAEKKAVNSGYNASIKKHKLSMHDRNQGILTGVLDREVEVRQLLDADKGRVKVIRLDTFEIVSDRPMDDEERQLRLEDLGPTKTAKTDDEERERADEQKNAATPEEAEKLRSERITEEVNDRCMSIVAGLMLMVKVEPAVDGGGVTLRIEEGEIVAEATGETESAARGELAQAVVRMVMDAEVKKTIAAAAKSTVAEVAPSAFVQARYDAIAPEITVVEDAERGAFVARFETPISVMDAEGDTEDAAREGLRAKLFAKFAEDEAKLAGGGAAPKVGLKAPPKANGKPKTNGAEPDAAAGSAAKPKAPKPTPPADDGAAPGPESFCEPGCAETHVHEFKPGEEGLQF